MRTFKMNHKLFITTAAEDNMKDQYERGTITYVSKYSDLVRATYTIWSDKTIDEETAVNAYYYVSLEGEPEIPTLEGLDYGDVDEMLDETQIQLSLSNLLKNADEVVELIRLANNYGQDISLEIHPNNIEMPIENILMDSLIWGIALRDLSEGINKYDLIELGKIIGDSWVYSNKARFLVDIVQAFLIEVEFTEQELLHIRNLQRALLMNDNSTIVSSSILYENANYSVECVVLEDKSNKHIYRLLINDHERRECEIIHYAKTLAKVNTYFLNNVDTGNLQMKKAI